MKTTFARVLATVKQTRVFRAFTRFSALRGNRLAGAVTFFGFVSLFPLLLLAVAVTGALLGTEGVQQLQDVVAENLPNVDIDVEAIQSNAAGLGVVGLVTLLITGLGWVDAMRAAVRSMWELEDAPGNALKVKALDVLALIGMGVILAVSVAITTVVTALTTQMFDLLGIESGAGQVLLRVLSYGLAVLASAVLFGYLISGFPRIPVPRGVLLRAALAGGLVFELLKWAVVGVLAPGDNPTQNAFAAFAAPLVLLAWIYLVTRVLMFLAAYTAESAHLDEVAEAEEIAFEENADRRDAVTQDEVLDDAREQGRRVVQVPGADHLVLTPSVRQARAVGVASGAVMGVVGAGGVMAARRGARGLGRVLRRLTRR